ncbi:MAG: iron ABC transporter permease [Thermotogae bacterium]|nr:iron ABC transporter permease [Thermotogota bacterium]
MTRAVVIFFPLLFFILFFYLPISSIFIRFFSPGAFWQGITSAYNLKRLSFTFKQAIVSTIVTIVLGLPGAYLIAKTSFKFKRTFLSLSLIPFIVPGVSVALGFISIFGNNGLLNRLLYYVFGVKLRLLYSFAAIIIGHSFYNFPIVVRIVSSSWLNVDPIYEEEAKIDGAGRFKSFFYGVLPFIFPSIIASALIIFIYCFLSFSIVLILGGARFATLEVQIYMYATTFVDFRSATALITLQLVLISILTFMLSRFKVRFIGLGEVGGGKVKKFPKWGWGYLSLVLIVVFLPVAAIFVGGFWDYLHNRFSLLWMKNVFSTRYSAILGTNPIKVIFNSIIFSISSAFVVILLSTMAAYICKRIKKAVSLMDSIFIAPLAISPLTLAFGYISVSNIFSLPIPVELPIVYALLSFPLAFQSISATWSSIPDDFEDAARTFGANEWQVLRYVDLPIIFPALVSSFALAVAIGFGELGATLMLYSPEYTTIPVAIYRFLSSRHYGEAQAIGTLLVAVAGAMFIITDRMHER